MPFRYEPWTDTGQRFGRADNQIPIWLENFGNFIEQFLPVFQGEVDGHVPAQHDIKFAQPGQRQHQVEFTEINHGAELVVHFPGLASQGKVFGEFIPG